MSSVGDVRDAYGSELKSGEAVDLWVENQQLYRLILQLILDLNDLEEACGSLSAPLRPPCRAPNSR
jgi:hypothetical protein